MDARTELAPFVAAVAQEQRDLYVAFLASLGIDDNVAAIDIEQLAAELQSLRDSVDDRFEEAEEEHLPMDPRAREPRADLARHLAARGLTIKDVPKDGDCQFHAIADQLKLVGLGDWDALELRLGAVHWLETNGTRWMDDGTVGKRFMLKDSLGVGDWPAYLADMRRRGTWGDEATLLALSVLFQVEICVISSSSATGCRVIKPPDLWEVEMRTTCALHVGHLAEVHYVSTRLVTGEAAAAASTEEDADAMAEGLAQQSERELWQAAEHEQRLVAMMCHPYQLEEAVFAEEDMMEGQFEEGGDDEEEGEEAWAATPTQIPTKIPRFHSPVPPGGRVGTHTRFDVEGELPGAFGEVGVLSCFKGSPPSTVRAFGEVGVLSCSKGPPPSIPARIPTTIERCASPVPPGGRVGKHNRFVEEGDLLVPSAVAKVLCDSEDGDVEAVEVEAVVLEEAMEVEAAELEASEVAVDLLDVIGSMRAPPSASDRIDAQMQDAEVVLGGVEAAAGVVEAVAAIAPDFVAIAETPAEAQEWELEQEWGWVEHLLTPGAFPEEEAEALPLSEAVPEPEAAADTVAATKVAKLRVSLVCRGLGKGGKKEILAERLPAPAEEEPAAAAASSMAAAGAVEAAAAFATGSAVLTELVLAAERMEGPARMDADVVEGLALVAEEPAAAKAATAAPWAEVRPLTADEAATLISLHGAFIAKTVAAPELEEPLASEAAEVASMEGSRPLTAAEDRATAAENMRLQRQQAADEARATAAAEGLELVPSPSSKTGFKGVCRLRRRFVAKISENGTIRFLGLFATPEEAALCYARQVGAERAATRAAEMRIAVQNLLSTADEAIAAAAVEGLALVRSSKNRTGFMCVHKRGRIYTAEVRENNKRRSLGNFATREAAALCYARYIGPERAAAEALAEAAPQAEIDPLDEALPATEASAAARVTVTQPFTAAEAKAAAAAEVRSLTADEATTLISVHGALVAETVAAPELEEPVASEVTAEASMKGPARMDADVAEGLAQQRVPELWLAAGFEQWLVTNVCHPVWQLEVGAPEEEEPATAEEEEPAEDQGAAAAARMEGPSRLLAAENAADMDIAAAITAAPIALDSAFAVMEAAGEKVEATAAKNPKAAMLLWTRVLGALVDGGLPAEARAADEAMTVAEMRELLASRGLNRSGNRVALANRLLGALVAAAVAAPEEEEPATTAPEEEEPTTTGASAAARIEGSRPLTADEARAAAVAERLELVPSSASNCDVSAKLLALHDGINELDEEAEEHLPRLLTAEHEAAAAVGLVLVPSSCNETGFKGVTKSYYKGVIRYQAHIWDTERRLMRYLGSFARAEDAAVCYSRHIGAERAAAEAAEALIAGSRPPTADEARGAAAAVGLVLVPSSCNETGFKGVTKSYYKGVIKYHAQIWDTERRSMRYLWQGRRRRAPGRCRRRRTRAGRVGAPGRAKPPTPHER